MILKGPKGMLERTGEPKSLYTMRQLSVVCVSEVSAGRRSDRVPGDAADVCCCEISVVERKIK